MDLYSNLLNFINQANQIKPLEQEFGDLAYNDQGQAYSQGQPVDYTDVALNRATQAQNRFIPPLQVQTRQVPKMPTITQMFRPVIPTQKIKASQSTIRNLVQAGDPKTLQLIKKYFPPEQWSNAVAIMNAESGGRNIPSQFNKYGTESSHGLFQINLQAHPQMRDKVYNPEENVKYAGQLFKQSGWRPWLNSAKKLKLL